MAMPPRQAGKAARGRAATRAAARLAPVTAVGPAPADLNPDEVRWWGELSAAIDLVRVFTPADRPMFRALVKAYALYEDIMDGDVLASGLRRVNANAATALLAKIYTGCNAFGLSPAGRATVAPLAAAPERRDDPDSFSTGPKLKLAK